MKAAERCCVLAQAGYTATIFHLLLHWPKFTTVYRYPHWRPLDVSPSVRAKSSATCGNTISWSIVLLRVIITKKNQRNTRTQSRINRKSCIGCILTWYCTAVVKQSAKVNGLLVMMLFHISGTHSTSWSKKSKTLTSKCLNIAHLSLCINKLGNLQKACFCELVRSLRLVRWND